MAKNIKDLDKSILTTSDYTDNSDVSINTDCLAKIGALNSLQTSNKSNLVAAINEVFQSANSGKQLIANAIGNPSITVNSTFSAMGEAIEDLSDKANNLDAARDTLAGLMKEGGYDITGDEDINSLLDLLVLSGISVNEIKQIACGTHTFILKYDGSVWACGKNTYGELGLGDTTTKYIFTKVTTNVNNDVKQISCGDSHTFIIKNDGSVWSCGRNGSGQLGLNNTTDRNVFTQVTTNINNDVKQIACGGSHTFILKNNGSLWACGNNGNGQSGLGSNTYRATFTQVTTNINNDVKQIACGSSHTFIIKNDGSVWACGKNTYGQLGLNNTTNQKTFTQVTTNINNDVKQIACGGSHTFILKNNGSLWACGYNEDGELGLDITTSMNRFVQVTDNINNDVKEVICGDSHTFIIKNDGSVWSTGRNDYGQLGLNSNASQKTIFTKVTTNVNNDVKQIVCGLFLHTVILKNDGSLWSCGNNYGQLGLGTINTNNGVYLFTMIPRGVY